ncbi:isoleucine--tRNA ligase [Crateriforma conspicua]|uniref:isoleucine--tRNA ligase n=1 Tax=Crateriforma conspicua TaxID=2527996 RepID=UPI00118D2BB3|nr:isoleucine--tRNA ligase [Crateriforma conspicua]QDV63172.1 Isoleucine--tRNA ligase [Crateriforma conspicua]
MSDSASPFRAPNGSPNFPSLEQEVLEFWDQNDIYAQSLSRRKDADSFVFFEGPPTANGLPHPGHCLTRSIKDVFPRYQTMKGLRCQRKAGWDTHGLPVEVEVGKDLGIHSKEEIEAYGVEPFIQKCEQSVFRYIQQWQQLTRRLGFWVDLDDAYVTYHQSYVESVWWSLKNLFDRGLLYQGHKIVWWWAQGGTALSAGEVGQGYREVADPSVYVLFPLVDHPGRNLVVWTTTPWTLPSNMYAAVHPDLTYSICRDDETDSELVIASDLVETIAGKLKRELPVIGTVGGDELIGLRYEPPFDFYKNKLGDPQGKLIDGGSESLYWRVVEADFVTTDSGTGLVHQAPAFGEVDHEVLVQQRLRFTDDSRPELLCAVGPDGKFTSEVAGDAALDSVVGVWVKDADKPLSRMLKERGRLLLLDQYLHEYPFCWRASSDPLIQYPRQSWFIRTTKFKDLMLKNNAAIGWQPEHIRDGRFGNFLASNVDWALSRERYWGTPLPIWVCESTGRGEAIGSYDELLAKPGVDGTQSWEKAKAADPDLSEHLKVHKPYIDDVTYDSPFADGARMRRVPEVIDCWYDSGAMPFAQYGWPHQNDDLFADQFPADFISEALDQTRGWFYSQLAISTMLFGEGGSLVAEGHQPTGQSLQPDLPYPHPYRNCIVLGLMLGEDGKKMSKSEKNYREPDEIFDRYGADALRWFFFSGQTPWTAIQYREQAIKDSIPEFLLRLWNVYSFFMIYAEIDGFDPTVATAADANLSPQSLASAPTYRPADQRSEIDRWILSELNQTIQTVTERMDALDNYNACEAITHLVDGLSNWYVRRSRDRFWASDKDSADKHDAYWTLYESLLQVSRLIAPFVPFIAETLWRRLAEPFGDTAAASVHLCDYPQADSSRIDANLTDSMSLLREIASMGRSARADAKLKVRLPLSKVEVVLASDDRVQWLQSHDALVKEELNVKQVEYTTEGDQYVQYTVVPNFKRLGPKVGKQVPAVKKALAQADGNELLALLQRDGKVTLSLGDGSVELDNDDIEVRLQARDGWAAAQGRECVVVLNTEVTDELRREGAAKDLIRVVQNERKRIDCNYTDRIEIGIVSDDDDVNAAIDAHAELIKGETLADALTTSALDGVDAAKSDLGSVYVRKVDG